MKVTFLIYTYDRIDDAHVNIELIRALYADMFDELKIVHAYNGEPDWYEKSGEDVLLTTSNSGHFSGAAELIDLGMKHIQDSYTVDYVIVLAADTWLLKPDYIAATLKEMQTKEQPFATCAWGSDRVSELSKAGSALDFFIVDQHWALEYDMFPIDYAGFEARYGDLLLYQEGLPVFLEKVLLARYMAAAFKQHRYKTSRELHALNQVHLFTERQPVHEHSPEDDIPRRKGYVPSMGLAGFHNPEPKQAILRTLGISGGVAVKKLFSSEDLGYYNRGIRDKYPFQVVDDLE